MTSQTRQLFGTDGIRGVAGEFPLTVESTYLIGRALGHDLVRSAPHASVVIGQDTRESSSWIADRVTLGLVSSGCEVHSAGVITTPGVAYLAGEARTIQAVSQHLVRERGWPRRSIRAKPFWVAGKTGLD